ncbi:lipopolysaccharide biosynthesis protein [Larkinella terrae]|uniref:Oligosaccharide flippase family protein n=1 Tax=Larkinella terrae TaxID=2025311 RepID=A0A7K0EUP0_9BACT|nr:oligosaccharide flippase family protein [Larkinella terrae]MRS65527.1 oligosaccharide flippase family protein [Larkinella terrae]
MSSFYKNSFSGILQFVFTSLLTFVSIPVFINKLGIEVFGAFSMITLIGNLNTFANLGLNATLIKFLSEQGKSKESGYDIIVSFTMIMGLILPLSLLAIACEPLILKNGMGFSNVLFEKVNILYICVIISNIFILVGQLFVAVLDSQQYIYLTNFFQGVYSFLYWGGSILAIIFGFGLTGIGIVTLGATFIWFLFITISMFKNWGAIAFEGVRKNFRRVMFKQLSHTSKIYSSSLISLLFEPLTKIMVSRMIGVAEVGYLEIAYKIRTQFWSLITKATYPLYPKIAAENNIFKLSKLIINFQILIAACLAPIITLFVFLLKDTLAIWIGSTNPVVITATLWISVTYLIGSVAIPVYYYLMSKQHADKTLWLQGINVLVNCVTILICYQKMGIFSAILGNSLAILSSLCLSIFLQIKYLNSVQINWKEVGTFLLLFVLGCLFALMSQSFINIPALRILSGILIIVGFYSTVGYAYAPQLMNVYRRLN